MAWAKLRNPGEIEFHQAIQEVIDAVRPVLDKNPEYRKAKILERLFEPEIITIFRVPWMDDRGEAQVNTGYRIGMNSAKPACRVERPILATAWGNGTFGSTFTDFILRLMIRLMRQ